MRADRTTSGYHSAAAVVTVDPSRSSSLLYQIVGRLQTEIRINICANNPINICTTMYIYSCDRGMIPTILVQSNLSYPVETHTREYEGETRLSSNSS